MILIKISFLPYQNLEIFILSYGISFKLVLFDFGEFNTRILCKFQI